VHHAYILMITQWRREAGARALAGKGCVPADEGTKTNRVNSKIKLLKSPENNFDIDIFINPKESIDIADIQCISVVPIFLEQKYQYRIVFKIAISAHTNSNVFTAL